MQDQAKLVSCLDGNGHKRQFVILLNVSLGTGAFGTVNKAFEQTKEDDELAVKIIPYLTEANKETIKKQVEILKNLPPNKNLVSVVPVQCFSEKNFYIFMEYCNEGTLSDQMRSRFTSKTQFSEEEIFKAFYEILNGYQALWKTGILHQDLKPENILIKDGTYKITDFGFSIFYQGVKLDKIRQGTCEYMPLQKLTVPNYFASTKSDVFSLGVIFFKMLTGKHPYLLRKILDHRDYTKQLMTNQINVPSYFRAKLSIPMQQLFEVILKMVAKQEKDRIDFDEIYQFIKEQQMFLKFSQQPDQNSQYFSLGAKVPQTSGIKFVEVSKAFMIPFSIPRQQQEEYQKLLKDQKLKSQQKQKYEILSRVERYIFSMRIMVYFFDRLNRRLIVERQRKMVQQPYSQDLEDFGEVQEKAILSLVYTASKITVQTLQDARYARIFSKQDWNIYRKNKPEILQLVKKDEQYLKCLTNQIIMETKQSKISDRHRIIQRAKRPLLQFLSDQVRSRLIELLETRTSWIPIDNKPELVTLYFITSAIEIIDNFKERHERWEQLEGFFRKMESQNIDALRVKVTEGLNRINVKFSIDEGQLEEA